MVDFLRATAKDEVLQALADEHIRQTDGVTAAGAGCTHGEVDATQAEDGAEVHRHGGVHGLEDESTAKKCAVMLVVHDVGSLNHGFRGGVVAKRYSRFRDCRP